MYRDSIDFRNFSILLNIALYFNERKSSELALQVLYKLIEVKKYQPDIESANPTIFMTVYDEIAGIHYG